MQIRISDIVAQPHLEYFNSNALHQADHGGRAGYKSSKNGIKIALKMLSDPTCEVVVARQDYSDHKDSTFAQLKWAFNKLGVKLEQGKHYPEGNNLWIKLPQGNYVHFKQMKEIDKLKGTMPRKEGNAIKIVWFFEITQFKGRRYLDEAIASFARGNKDYMHFFYEWNDHPKLSHWTYEWVKDMESNPDAYVNKVNYCDAPEWQQEKFLGKILLKEIQRLKEISPEQYKSTYLGLPANLGGSVYKLFSRERHVKRATNDYMDIWVGVDYGASDATAFTAVGVKQNFKGLEVFKTYRHKNGQEGIKDINQYKDDLIQFVSEIFAQHRMPITVFIDPANLAFIQLVERETYRPEHRFLILDQVVKRSSDKNKSSVQERIDLTEIMFGSDFITIDPSCTNLIKAIEEAEYNDKNERADDGRSDIDDLDSFEYAWLKEKKIIREIILG